jgi:hypothetical protein
MVGFVLQTPGEEAGTGDLDWGAVEVRTGYRG